MLPGSVVSRGDRLFVVLASQDARAAIAPLSFNRGKRRSGDVSVDLVKTLGLATVLCASAVIESRDWDATGISISVSELSACQRAAAQAKREQSLMRFAPLSDVFEACKPVFRSGGRRVGGGAARV